jgi:hypothetical protein
MPSVDELLAEVSSETNAVASANKGLSAIGAFIDDILVKLETGDIEGAKRAVRDLQSLNTGLVSAVPASVTPESAGPVGKSRAEQALDTAEATVREHMAKLADILQGVSNASEHIRASVQAIADGRAQT